MKKLLILILFVGAGYKLYSNYGVDVGAFDANGNAQAYLFTVEGCGSPCLEAKKLLDKRNVDYEEVVVTDGDEQLAKWQRFGSISTMPILVVGNERVAGYRKWEYISALALNFDTNYLTNSEAAMFAKNFTSTGEPKLVMYTMDGCGYCEAAIRQLKEDGISFEERNSSVDYTAKSELDKFETGTPLIYFGYRRFVGWSEGVHKSIQHLM